MDTEVPCRMRRQGAASPVAKNSSNTFRRVLLVPRQENFTLDLEISTIR